METGIQGVQLLRRDETNAWTGLWEVSHSGVLRGSVYVSRLATDFFIDTFLFSNLFERLRFTLQLPQHPWVLHPCGWTTFSKSLTGTILLGHFMYLIK